MSKPATPSSVADIVRSGFFPRRLSAYGSLLPIQEEITAEVLRGPHSIVLEQAENRKFAQTARMSHRQIWLDIALEVRVLPL
jgi:hypothetical protein